LVVVGGVEVRSCAKTSSSRVVLEELDEALPCFDVDDALNDALCEGVVGRPERKNRLLDRVTDGVSVNGTIVNERGSE
jgi:hypothetical protein